MTTETRSPERLALEAFAERHGVTLTAERITRETFHMAVPPEKGEKVRRDRTYWTLTLTRGTDSLTVPYSQGSSAWWKVRGPFMHRREGEGFGAKCGGCFTAWPCDDVIRMSWLPGDAGKHARPEVPGIADLLDCMASDAGGYDNARDFADWCSECGYDEDSRTAERTYNMVAEQLRQLRRVLGSEAYRELIETMERL